MKDHLLKIILATYALVFALKSYSQDIIYTKKGDKILSIVEEITPDLVRYKQYDNQTGPTYSIFKSDILLIDYENGKTETFERQNGRKTANTNTVKVSDEDFGRHFVGINIAGMMGTNLHILYEYTFKNNIIGIRIPLLYRISSGVSDVFEFTNNFLTGVDFRFFPAGQGMIKYVFTPSMLIGNVKYSYYTWIPDPIDPWGGSENVESRKDLQTIFQIYNGIVFTPIPNLRFGMDLGVGVRNIYGNFNETRPYGSFVSFIGYKF